MPNDRITQTQNDSLIKTDKQSEGLYLSTVGNQIELGFSFDSAISRITPVILVGLMLLSILSYHTNKIYEFLIVFIFIVLMYFLLILIKEPLFYKSEIALKLKRIEKLGDSKKGLLPNIEDAQIYQPTTRQKTISAKANIVNKKPPLLVQTRKA